MFFLNDFNFLLFRYRKGKKRKISPAPPCKILKKVAAEFPRHTFISTIYPLNRKSKIWLKFCFCFHFTFTFSNDADFFLLFFYFLTEKVYFLFYFSKFRKKFTSTKFFNEWYRHLIVSHTGVDRDIVKFRRFEKIPLFSRFWISEKIKLSKITPSPALRLFCVPR